MSLIPVILTLLLAVSCRGQLFTEPDRPTNGVRIYLQPDDKVVEDFDVIDAGFFDDTDNDILWCQSANSGSNIGDWYEPNGNKLTTSGTLRVYRTEGQIGLLRTGGIAGREGLFRCVIPDENGVNQTLWVGIYRTATYSDNSKNVIIENPMAFTLVTANSTDSDPPVFTLSFNVTNYPPSNVVCDVDGTDVTIDDIDREVTNSSDPVRVLVTVTISTRQSGSYQCTVSATGPDGLGDNGLAQPAGGGRQNTDGLSITVTDYPVNVTVSRDSLSISTVTWSPPISNSPIVQGYDVFYYDELSDGTSLMSVNVGNNTMVILDGLDPELSYTVLVVAYGGDLPSNNISGTVSEAVSLTVSGPSNSTVPYNGSVQTMCTLTVNVPIGFYRIVWFGSDIINSQMELFMDDNMMMDFEPVMYSLNLSLNGLSAADAGVYTCGVELEDTFNETVGLREDHTVFFEIPSPNVSISLTPGTPVNRTFITGIQYITCTAIVTDVDVPVDVTITWSGPNGTVTNNDKYQIETLLGGDMYLSQLNITNLNTSDNMTMYSCRVEVGVNTDIPMNYTNFTLPGVGESEPVTLIIEALPIPEVNIAVTGAPIVGETFNLTCSAVFDESLATVSYQWFINGSFPNSSNVLISNDNTVLTVTNVNTTDQGTYMCTAVLSFTELLSVPGVSSASDIYNFFTLGDPEVMITVDGSNIAGSAFTLTCNVRVISGVPDILWTDPLGAEIDNSSLTLETESNGNYRLLLSLDPLDYTSVGEYTCTANLSVPAANFEGTGSDTQIVNIRIPSPDVTISTDSIDNYTRGTERTITCDMILNTPLPSMGTNVTLEWRKDGVPFDSSSDRLIESDVSVGDNNRSTTIRFSPLNTTDTGDYQCIGTIEPIMENNNIIGSNDTATLQIDVGALPDAMVTISSSGSGMAGDPYSLTCTVTTKDGLTGFTNNLTQSVMTDNGYTVLNYSTDSTSVTVDLSPLTTSNGGLYTCSYTTENSVIDYQRMFEDSMNVTVTIPPLNVSVTTDPVTAGSPLVEGTYIDLVCNISVNDGVDTDISVTVEWTRNGVTITNGSDYTISDLKLVSSNNYISTVRIEELGIGDNNTVYRCTATATPSVSTYIIGNNGDDEFTTNVREFMLSDVSISISFSPSTPTVDDQLNITCSASVPERLVDSPSAFVISYDVAGQQHVDERNPNATQSDVLRDGNVFSRVITINPVKSSDGRRYYCEVSFGPPLGASPEQDEALSVNLPPPTMSISLSPDGVIYESTLLVITCNATLPSTVDTGVSAIASWSGPNGLVTSTNDGRITVNPAVSIEDNVFQSLLTFNPVDNGDNMMGTNDTGTYTCEITVSSDDNDADGDGTDHDDFLLQSTNNISDTVSITALPDITATISTSGSTEVGQSLNITCTVVLVEGFVGNISVTWDKMDDVSELEDLGLPQTRVEEGSVINSTLIMNPVQFNYRGMYTCSAMYNVTLTFDGDSIMDNENLVVDFPPFDIEVSRDYNDPLYTGTPLVITCNTTLSDLVDISVDVTTTWTRNGTNITQNTVTDDLESINNLTHFTTLDFYPLNYQTDNGDYRCMFTVTPSSSVLGVEYIASMISNSSSTTLNVLDLPDPVVSISRSSPNPDVDDPFELECNVSVVDRLIVSPEIEWSRIVSTTSNNIANDISVVPVRTGNTLSLDFTALDSSDAGRYTCESTLTVTQINTIRSSSSTEDLTLQIPSPVVMVTRTQSNDSTLLAGSNLTIYCDIDVDTNVDTPFTVDTVWTRTDSDGSNEVTLVSTAGRVIVYDPVPMSGTHKFQSSIVFNTLSSVYDSGEYVCDVTINSNSNYTFVYDSNNDSAVTSFEVTDPMITNFGAMPNSISRLESMCFDSDPFDNFTLTCYATKPAIVLPELELFWLHNGTQRTSNSMVISMTDAGEYHIQNTLIFNTTTPEDAGTYECVARILIPESTNITSSVLSVVNVTAAQRPYVPYFNNVTVTAISAAIRFAVPSIAYTQEQYRIGFIGLELQNTPMNSTTIINQMDITAVDQEYSITLNGLEEDNTYNFTIISTNCIGETETNTYSFTTNTDRPSGVVRDCTNTTFNPRDVTLTWNPPERALHNGDITGYELLCQQEGSNMPLANTNGSSNSTNTSFTITDITPFRRYNCSISAINNDGVGPMDFCIFYSAQDIPSDAPTNFTSDPEQFSTTFSWYPPSIPNGPITEYSLVVTIQGGNTTRDTSPRTNMYTINANEGVNGVYSRRIDGLLAYQEYNATVSGSTVVGYGPDASTSGRTDPDTSSRVRLYTINATGFDNVPTLPNDGDNALNVTWRPPLMPNGYISSYRIDVVNNRGETNQALPISAVDGQEVYTMIVTNLNPGTPYYVTIGAVNELGQGENITVTAFTATGGMTVTPENVESSRSDDGTEITVSWDRISLEDAGGFFETRVTLSGERSRKRQEGSRSISVPYTESSATFTGLEPAESYSVSAMVAVIGQDGMEVEGPTSEPISVTPGPDHTTAPPPAGDSTTIIIIIVVVVLVVILVLVVIVVIILVVCSKRRKSKTGSLAFGNDLYELSGNGNMLTTLNTKPTDLDDKETNGGTIRTSFVAPIFDGTPTTEEDKEEQKEDLGYVEAEKTIDRSNPVAKASFHEHVVKLHEEADKEFESEYKSVPMATESPVDCALTEANKLKNRFSNIFPYDFSRVKLTPLEGAPDSDYINASFVDGYSRKDCYICAQGPLPTTLGDFWRMIWENRVTNLVMLTGVIEGGKKKCEQYWPENVGDSMETQSGLNITTTSRVPFSDYTIHSLKVSKLNSTEGDPAPLDITHFHYTAWPDHGVPQFATSLIGFINRVQKSHDKTKAVPLLVHCSAGVGRTGTFVMLDSMMDRLRVEDSLNVYEFLKQMRSKRMYMVQTLAQYVFIHDALDEYITCGETDISATNLKVRVSKMHKMIPSKNINGFQEQFQLLEQVCYVPNESVQSDAVKPFNAQKNRYPNIIPLNLNRPRLRPDGSDGSDYINASCVDGYKQRNAYLVTQGPLKSTAADFWRMVVEFKSKCIVMLCNTVEEGQEKCYMYWPTKEGEPVEHGKYMVTLQSETVSGDYIIRKITVQNDKSSNKTEREGISITQFHYTQWPEHGFPSVTGQIIELIDILTRSQMNTGNKPITVVCNDGIGRSGAFLCIHSQLERLKTEGEIDVFKYLKSARTKRIGLVSEIDQYVFVHQVLADYVESFDPYSNFNYKN